jgi:hypothetical protein
MAEAEPSRPIIRKKNEVVVASFGARRIGAPCGEIYRGIE